MNALITEPSQPSQDIEEIISVCTKGERIDENRLFGYLLPEVMTLMLLLKLLTVFDSR